MITSGDFNTCQRGQQLKCIFVFLQSLYGMAFKISRFSVKGVHLFQKCVNNSWKFNFLSGKIGDESFCIEF